MTRTTLVSIVLFSASILSVGCSKDAAPTSTDTTTSATTASKADTSDGELAKINALVPAELRSSLVFERFSFHGDANGDGSTGHDERVTAYRPKGWLDEAQKTGMEDEFYEPLPDAKKDDISARVDRGELSISHECDGSCVPKDWNALAQKRIDQSMKLGPGVKDEKLPHNGRIRWGVTPDDATFYRASVYAAWPTEGANVMRTCEVTLHNKKFVAALDAFAEACKASQTF